MTAIDVVEVVVRAAGFALVATAWGLALWGASSGERRPAGRACGLARRLRAHIVYLIGAIPYFAMCALLWRPIPLELPAGARYLAALVGGLVGLGGAWFYLWGRRELGAMYNVSSSLGSELYREHRLITSGPYRIVRHPMYLGLGLSALGGLAVYRTWTLVFMVAALSGAIVKARREEKLLAVEFGEAWERYAQRVPSWIPHLRRPNPAEIPGRTR